MMRCFLETSSLLERCFDTEDEEKTMMRKRVDRNWSLIAKSLSALNLERAALSLSFPMDHILAVTLPWLLPSLPINAAGHLIKHSFALVFLRRIKVTSRTGSTVLPSFHACLE